MSAGTMEEDVLKLKEKLIQCQLERDRLRTQNEFLMIKEKLVTREKQELEEKLGVELEANLCATSEFEKRKKPLKDALDAGTKSLRQLEEDFNELRATYPIPCMKERSDAADDRIDKLFNIPEADRIKLAKLRSEIKEKRDKLLAFLKTCVKNSKITDDVKPLLQVHYDAYIGTLKTDVDDGCKKLRKYVHRVLQPGLAQTLNVMFAKVDLISPISAAISYIVNFLLRIKEFNGSLIQNASVLAINKHKLLVRGIEDDESEHLGQASMAKKLWDFIIT